MDKTAHIKNHESIRLGEITSCSYEEFRDITRHLLAQEANHCIHYFAVQQDESLNFFMLVANDINGDIQIYSHHLNTSMPRELPSLSVDCPALHIFERSIYEEHGVQFTGHPWLKPVRYPSHGLFKYPEMDKYPFYSIPGEMLHEVGVGPIHAGIIEPGHFRFICNGEQVLHLEIQLGYQHRGIEPLLLKKQKPLQHSIIAENIAGDAAIGHSLANSMLLETLSGIQVSETLQSERLIALEMERMAMHIADTAALCTDVAYQFGQVVNEALRTMIINGLQLWCGNRFGKGLIRTGGSHYPLSASIAVQLIEILDSVKTRYTQVADQIFSLPSVLDRFESVGVVTREQSILAGSVGMAARMSGLKRDIRASHPYGAFRQVDYSPVVLGAGDVWARGMLRNLELRESMKLTERKMLELIELPDSNYSSPRNSLSLLPESMGVSLIEGWRGEICHIAITDDAGQIRQYKVKDPSMHNWFALALAVRNQEISDFPVCNKSFNLSYCGHDL